MKPIKNAPGYYIDKSGKVFTTIVAGRWKEPLRELGVTPNRDGYLTVRIYINGKRTRKPMHRLLAEAFLPNPNGFKVVRHLNDIKTDNRLENLAWGTCDDNAKDMVRNGKSVRGRPIARSHHGSKNPNAKLTPLQVDEIRQTWNPGITYADLGRKYGVTYVTIRRIVHGDLWKGTAARPKLAEIITPDCEPKPSSTTDDKET